MKRLLNCGALILLTALCGESRAGEELLVTPFSQDGVLVEVTRLFTLPEKASAKLPKLSSQQTEVSRWALVTTGGVYAFLESPENQQFVARMKPNAAVRVNGKLLTSGSLLHIDTLSAAKEKPAIDLKKYRDDKGTAVTLNGTNLCQCGLNVSDLPHSCKLGHLHHLQTTDGKIYHYLPVGEGSAAFLGKGSHFQKVEVQAKLFPGNFLLVERIATQR